ncbi:hypothetical protein J2W28_000976 [Variovorax boronicumulans]|uniref:hypothetical protein n=1 Tax=Variovorax boronicumulans TaxID=436515 RepID=UPI00278A9B3E|nr:hypothetical protein [Variovorax boronicumulans]MDP9991948.1 hypothetical protein [Variovorax boronicumulans]MDQ0001843.1 hypothetical protein [Variovorax boronicumulans]
MPDLPASSLTRDQWTMAFASAWHTIAEGRADFEQLKMQGIELYETHGKTDPAEYAQQHFSEAEARHQDRVRDPLGAFTALAVENGIIKAGDKPDQNLVDYAYGVVALCAKIGDGYGDPDFRNAGEHIRAVYGPI